MVEEGLKFSTEELEASRFPSFFEETGNKRLMDAEVFCEKNRKPRIRWK